MYKFYTGKVDFVSIWAYCIVSIMEKKVYLIILYIYFMNFA